MTMISLVRKNVPTLKKLWWRDPSINGAIFATSWAEWNSIFNGDFGTFHEKLGKYWNKL